MAERTSGASPGPMYDLVSDTHGTDRPEADPVVPKIYLWRIEFRGSTPSQVVEATTWHEERGWIQFYVERPDEAFRPIAAMKAEDVRMVRRVGEAENQRLNP